MNTPSSTLTEQLPNTTATIGVIGLGYVGLPLGVAFTEAGFAVRGFDIDSAYLLAEFYWNREFQSRLWTDLCDDSWGVGAGIFIRGG